MRVRPVIFGFAVLLGAMAPSPVPATERQASDLTGSCRVRDPDPGTRKRFHWAGQCRNGFAQGSGVLEWTIDGRPAGWAEGTLVAGRLEGETRVEWEDGRSFTGTYRHGHASGHGTLAFPDGHRYVGSFEGGRPTGEGEFISSAGTRYAARLDEDGEVRPGAMLGPGETAPAPSARRPPPSDPGKDPLQAKPVPRHKAPSPGRSAARFPEKPAGKPMPGTAEPAPAPQAPDAVQSAERPPAAADPPPESLEEWLRTPPPVPRPVTD
ncbi:hypothetical protein [Azospirillum endophyticum]